MHDRREKSELFHDICKWKVGIYINEKMKKRKKMKIQKLQKWQPWIFGARSTISLCLYLSKDILDFIIFYIFIVIFCALDIIKRPFFFWLIHEWESWIDIIIFKIVGNYHFLWKWFSWFSFILHKFLLSFFLEK